MERKRSKTHRAASLPRTDRRIQEHENDPYTPREKLPDPTVCTGCGALYREGRWSWRTAPADAHQTRCPACRRIDDGCPAGLVLVRGEFAASHSDEIQALIRHVEEREKTSHPMKRIMHIGASEEGLEISTTDARLATGIGRALHRAYRGELDSRFTEAENVMRVCWTR